MPPALAPLLLALAGRAPSHGGPAHRAAARASRAPPPACLALDGELSSSRVVLALLNQRAVQTQLYFWHEFKNDCQRVWLEQFVSDHGAPMLCQSGGNMLHCADAFLSVEQEDFLLQMMGAPDEEHEIEVVLANRIGGGSPENPYLQPKKAVTTYTDVVSPAKIAHQLMRIRETIALEWQADLKLLVRDNDELRRHHGEEVRSLKDEQERFQHAVKPEVGAEASSPLRLSSFDLLKTAVTRCAVRSLYYELDRDFHQKHSAEWLRTFSEVRDHPLQGDHGWHAARAFILDIMAQPVMISTSPGGNPRFHDPLFMAERIMDIRAAIATQWADALKEVPSDHGRLLERRIEERALKAVHEELPPH